MNAYLAAVGGVTVLFGLGVWTAFTAGVRHGRAVEARNGGINDSVVARISEVGGTATIESHPGTGTRVTLRVPV